MIEIANWSETFENADTRKLVALKWVHLPTGCDSRGYRKLMRAGRDGIFAFGVFTALCQAMGQVRKEYRGVFRNSDGSLMEIEDISEIIRIPLGDMQEALSLLSEIKWVTQESPSNLPVISHPPPGNPPPDRIGGDRNGEESIGGEGSRAPERGFPEKQQVLDYAKEQGWPLQSALKFWLHYDSKNSNGDMILGGRWHWWSELEKWMIRDFQDRGKPFPVNGSKKPKAKKKPEPEPDPPDPLEDLNETELADLRKRAQESLTELDHSTLSKLKDDEQKETYILAKMRGIAAPI